VRWHLTQAVLGVANAAMQRHGQPAFAASTGRAMSLGAQASNPLVAIWGRFVSMTGVAI